MRTTTTLLLACLVLACRPAEETAEHADDPGEVAGRETARLLALCKGGNQVSCARLGVPASNPAPRDGAAAQSPPAASTRDRPSLADSPWPVPTAPFPNSVAGFAFDSSPFDVSRQCREVGGVALPLRGKSVIGEGEVTDGDMVACGERLPADPFLAINQTKMVMVEFCQTKNEPVPWACAVHVALALHDRDSANVLLDKLQRKYGPILTASPNFACRDEADRAAAFHGTWLWFAEHQGEILPLGSVLLNYGCTPVVPKPEIFLVYRDGVATFREFSGRTRSEF